MGEFFTTVYCLFDDLFGLELASYLAGEATERQQGNMFLTIGLVMLGISLLVAVLFYYVVNHPKLNNWWGWGIAAVLSQLKGRDLLPSDRMEEDVLAAVVASGGVDGVTSKPELTVDNLSLSLHLEVLGAVRGVI